MSDITEHFTYLLYYLQKKLYIYDKDLDLLSGEGFTRYRLPKSRETSRYSLPTRATPYINTYTKFFPNYTYTSDTQIKFRAYATRQFGGIRYNHRLSFHGCQATRELIQ